MARRQARNDPDRRCATVRLVLRHDEELRFLANKGSRRLTPIGIENARFINFDGDVRYDDAIPTRIIRAQHARKPKFAVQEYAVGMSAAALTRNDASRS